MGKRNKDKTPNLEPQPSSWKSALRRSIGRNEAFPQIPRNGFPEKSAPGLWQTTARYSWKTKYTATPHPSPLEVWSQKSDEAAQDVFTTMCEMFAFANVSSRVFSPEPQRPFEAEKLKRPVSEVVSELDSRASLFTQYSVSELGAEAESRPGHDSSMGIHQPTQRDLEAEGGAQSKTLVELEAPLAGMRLPSFEERVGLGPRAQKTPQQGLSIPTPRVIIQNPDAQGERWSGKQIFAPIRTPQQTPTQNIPKPLPVPPTTAPAQIPPLTAMVYFTVELPRSFPHRRGGYMRHFEYPLRLPLSTPQQLLASIAYLRGYLTNQPTRFLEHFSFTPQIKSGDVQFVVSLPSLFSTGGYGMEKIWGPELAWAWADASEKRFAEAMVLVLREVAEEALSKSKGRYGMVDVLCVVRQVVDGMRGYGLLMDVRRIGEDTRRQKRIRTGTDTPGNRRKENRGAGETARGGQEIR